MTDEVLVPGGDFFSGGRHTINQRDCSEREGLAPASGKATAEAGPLHGDQGRPLWGVHIWMEAER